MKESDKIVNILLKEAKQTVKRTNLMFWRWADFNEIKIKEDDK